MSEETRYRHIDDLDEIVGKTVARVCYHGGYSDWLGIVFEDRTYLYVGLAGKSYDEDPDSLHVGGNPDWGYRVAMDVVTPEDHEEYEREAAANVEAYLLRRETELAKELEDVKRRRLEVHIAKDAANGRAR